MGDTYYYTSPEGEEVKLTSSQSRFLKDAENWLIDAMEQGKLMGTVPLSAKLRLEVDSNLSTIRGQVVGWEKVQGKRFPIYIVSIAPEALGSWDTIRHEGGHVFLGHPEKGPSSGLLEDWRDFPSLVRRELETDFRSRRATDLLPEVYLDINFLVRYGVEEFVLSPEESFDTVREISREIGIPYQYIKRSRRELEEEGFF